MYITPVFMMHDDLWSLTDTVSFNADVINNKAGRFKRDTVSVSTLLKPSGSLVPKSVSSVQFLVLAKFEDPYCDRQRLSSIFPLLLTSTINAYWIYRPDLNSQAIKIFSVFRLQRFHFWLSFGWSIVCGQTMLLNR